MKLIAIQVNRIESHIIWKVGPTHPVVAVNIEKGYFIACLHVFNTHISTIVKLSILNNGENG